MSYILDALKRSDQDRLKGSTPDLQTQPEPPVFVHPPARNTGVGRLLFWAMVIVLLAAVLWFGIPQFPQQGLKPATLEAVAEPTQAAAPVDTAKLEPVKANSNEQTLEQLKGVQLDLAPAEAAPMAINEQPTEQPGPAASQQHTDLVQDQTPRSLAKTTPSRPQPTPKPDPYQGIPHQRQLSSDLQRSLPDLAISVHIYSESPASRLVRINNTTYREGDQVDRQLTLDEITPDGVIMSIRNNRFWRRNR
ncbi:general secretion pathway protein GspB [Pontibacter sp. JAM-7]|uniref:general secretion pathway protein GspB n=1 Tax=Pontibacter sp. JAM-7 TaxID=3366581 RepID=UPI003AF76DA0